LWGLVKHSVILALPDCAPAVELRRDSLSVISRAWPHCPVWYVRLLWWIDIINMSIPLI